MAITTIRDLVTKGLREGGIIEVGGIPEAAEFEEGLELLQELYSSFFGNELGEQLTTINYGKQGLVNPAAKNIDQSPMIDSLYVPVNVRVMLNLDADKILYLHPNPMDGARLAVIDNADNLATNNATLIGNGRQIEGTASITLATNGLSREWFYRADLGDWTKIIDLNADDVTPLPKEFNTLFSTLLALRVNPRYGAQTGQEMTEVLQRARKQFRARYRQNMEQCVEDGLIRLPNNPYWRFGYNDSNTFSRGF